MRLANLTLLVFLAWLPAASAQEAPGTRSSSSLSDVRDTAGLFSDSEVEAARARLQLLEQQTKVPTIIETVDSLRGKSVDEVAVSLARRLEGNGLFVLIAKRETKIEALPSHRVEAALPRAKRNAIRSAFIDKFRKKEFDSGLKQGVEAINVALREAVREGKLDAVAPKPPSSPTDGIPPLVPKKPDATKEAAKDFGLFRNVGIARSPIVRDQVRLTLEGARQVVSGAEQEAESLKLKANIWVVDDGGHPLAFVRMDGARPASSYTAFTKAVSAATYRIPSGPMPPGTTQPDLLLNLSLQNTALASGGKFTPLLGGVPIVVDGQVIGAVGVGGGTGEQDATVAKAGIEHLLSVIKSSGQGAKKPAEATKTAESDILAPKNKVPDDKTVDEKDF